MAINYFSLEKSEVELNENFLNLIKFSRKMYIKLINWMENKTVVTVDDLDKMNEYKSELNENRHDLRDDCIWIISKDQPRANHLRFIIAILYSLKDVERIGDYAYTITKILKKEKLTSIMVKKLYVLLQNSMVFYDKIIDILFNHKLEEKEDEVLAMFEQFKVNYKSFTTESIKSFATSQSVSQETIEYYFNYSIVIKYIDRVVDHSLAIYKNFMFIKYK